jgi:hypothetical protein
VDEDNGRCFQVDAVQASGEHVVRARAGSRRVRDQDQAHRAQYDLAGQEPAGPPAGRALHRAADSAGSTVPQA